MKFELYYSTKPHKLSQVWGLYRPEIYGQFGFTKHNGEDKLLGNGNIHCPVNGYITKIGHQPTGAGTHIQMVTDDNYEWRDGMVAAVHITFMHLAKVNVTAGQKVTVGDLLAIGDNTGYSTGPHLHEAHQRVYKSPTGIQLADTNEANGTFDPAPYYNGKYAVDEAQIKILKMMIALYQQVISMLKK